MGTLMRNRQVAGGTPVVDTALDTQSEDVVQNKVVAEAISTINSKLDNLIKEDTLSFSLSSQEYISNINIDNRKIIMVYARGVGVHIKYRISSGGLYVFQITNKDNGEIITSGNYTLGYFYV